MLSPGKSGSYFPGPGRRCGRWLADGQGAELDRAESWPGGRPNWRKMSAAHCGEWMSILTPLLAEEAARPSDDYRSAYPGELLPGKKGDARKALATPAQAPRARIAALPVAGRWPHAVASIPAGDRREFATQHGVSAETTPPLPNARGIAPPCHAALLALLPEHSPLVVTSGQLPSNEAAVPQVPAQPNVPLANPNR